MISIIRYSRELLHISEEYMCTFLSLPLEEYRAREKDPSLFTAPQLDSIAYFLGKSTSNLRSYKDYSMHDQEEVEKLLAMQYEWKKNLEK